MGGETHGALRSVRVLDLSRSAGYPGGYCTLLLAQLGADVLKVEQPGSGDALRANYTGGEGPAPAHVGLNRGKRSMTLDTRHTRAPEVLGRLVEHADVVVESARPGVMEAGGFGYPQAAERNPGIVWCSITGFGQDGPYAQWPGHDLSYMAQSGLLAALGEEMPWSPQIMLAVPIGAVVAVTGILAALEARRESGRGCQVDVSIAEAASWVLSGAPGILAGNAFRIPATADRRLYACADGRFVSVAAAEPRTWRALCEGLGLDDLAEHFRRDPELDRDAEERMGAAFRSRPAGAWVEQLGAAGAAIAPVNIGAELVDDAHVVARDAVVQVAGVAVPGSPLRLSGAEGARREQDVAGPPELGAHTAEALAAAGYSPGEIEELREAGLT